MSQIPNPTTRQHSLLVGTVIYILTRPEKLDEIEKKSSEEVSSSEEAFEVSVEDISSYDSSSNEDDLEVSGAVARLLATGIDCYSRIHALSRFSRLQAAGLCTAD